MVYRFNPFTATLDDVTAVPTAGSPVDISDIGTAPNQVPLNQYLGDLATQSSNAVVLRPPATAEPALPGDMTFQLSNDTTLVVKVKGSDGVVRSVTLTLA